MKSVPQTNLDLSNLLCETRNGKGINYFWIAKQTGLDPVRVVEIESEPLKASAAELHKMMACLGLEREFDLLCITFLQRFSCFMDVFGDRSPSKLAVPQVSLET